MPVGNLQNEAELRRFMDKALTSEDVLARLRAATAQHPGKIHVVGASGEPAFQNSWVVGGIPTVFYRVGGLVLIEGTLSGGTNNAAAFTLPSGFRPIAEQHPVIARTSTTGAIYAQLRITTAGEVIVRTQDTSATHVLSVPPFRAA